MIGRIIDWSLHHRLVVIVLFAILAGTGVMAVRDLPLDAFPDTTPVMVQVNTVAPALSPLEIEQQITFEVERALYGLPRLSHLRSLSRFGFSQVTLVFEEGTDLLTARQLVMERLQAVSLPDGIQPPAMGPIATGLGEIYHYLVMGDGWSLEALTTLHDWEIKPQLSAVPGVAEVNTWGGLERQIHVLVDPHRLARSRLTLEAVFETLRKNNRSVGGGVIEEAGEAHLVQGIGRIRSADEIGGLVIAAHDGIPIRVRDVAEVEPGHELRRGAVTANGEGEVVLGLAFMLMGENSREVTRRLQERMAGIQASLPEGVRVRPVYERTELVDQVIDTVRKNLFEGALLVIAVLFALLGNLRAGLIVALAIPLSMLFAAHGMLRFGIAGSLMSLGAIDFGLIVDSSVIMVENSVRRLAEAPAGRSRLAIIRDASLEVRKPTMYGELIIMIVYLPVLTLEGIEGQLFRPMALTVVLALAGSLLLSLTLMPVLASLCLPARARERRNPLMIAAVRLYRPIVRLAIRFSFLFAAAALALVAGGVILGSRLGAEFVPRLSEMGIVINTVRLSGIALEESVRYGDRIERLLLERFPDEIRDVWTRTGTAEIATDPMGIEVSDVFLMLTPRAAWTRARTQDELTNRIREELAGLPGMRMVFTQPIEMRVNEMLAGIRTDVGIVIFGDDFDALKAVAADVEALLRTVPGAVDVYTEQLTGQPVLEIEADAGRLARHGLHAEAVLELVELAGGRKAGSIREGQRRVDLVVRLAEPYRRNTSALGRLLVPGPDGEAVPLADLASLRSTDAPAAITREWQRRRILVQCNVEGRDLGGFVAEARERLEGALVLPPGYRLHFGGQYEHLIRAQRRLMIVIPLALFLILFLLHLSTGSVRDALLIFTGAPFAALGGIAALAWRGMPFTISAGVGFVAVSGVAMLNGLVLVSTIGQARARGVTHREAIEQSALLRLRPILTTALVASLGFVPMALNTGVGAEVQRPLATVVIGGVVADCILSLLMLPAFYALFGESRRPDPAEATN